MRIFCLTFGLFLATACTCDAAAQSKPKVVTKVVPLTISKPVLPADAATVEQFKEYFRLTGVDAAWRERWVAAVDLNREKGRPYWPESFWNEIKADMGLTDLAPVARKIWGPVLTSAEMSEVNTAIKRDGVELFAKSSLGQKFGKDWDSQQEQQQQATLALTRSLIMNVYEKDKPQLDAARTKYMAEHPDYKE